MTDQGQNDLTKLIGECAAALQSALIVKTGKNRVFTVISDKREWRGPPLRPNIKFGGIDLNDLPKALYGEPHMLMSMRQEVWDVAVDWLCAGSSIAKLSGVYFPSVLFTSEPRSAPLPQLLCALSWHGGKLEVTQQRASLCFGRGHYPLEIDQRTMTHREERRRLPRACAVNPISLLTRPIGRAKSGSANTTAVFRHLSIEFPELNAELDVIFATAVHAGREYELMLSRQFDVVEVDDITATATVWVQARRIVNTAIEAPYSELWVLMKDLMTQDAFTKLFGNPYRKRSPLYSARMRQHHASVIDRAENGEINLAVQRQVGGQVEAANNLLKLQQMMGSKP